MKELIELKFKNEKGVVSARDLYRGLQVTDRFNRWFEALLKYGYEKDKDYTSVEIFTLVNNGAKRKLDDYLVSIDMAKEICMLQRNDMGRKFRKYFIACEKELKARADLRIKSIATRNVFTQTLKEHDYEGFDYKNTTVAMKKSLDIQHKKGDMTKKELIAIEASESLARLLIDGEYGYSEVNPVCVEAADLIKEAVDKKKKQIA